MNRPPGKLEGQVAIVTGGTSGIGRQACLALAREGAAVVIVGRNRARLTAVAAEVESLRPARACPRGPLGLSLDVSREEDMAAMAKETLQRFGRIDILVASAGILRGAGSRPTRLLDLTSQEWDGIVDTNLKGVFLSNRAVLQTMRAQRSGRIINIASLSGRRAVPFDTPYSASKFGVVGLTQALAREMEPYGVRVQALLPGNTDTPIWSQNEPLPPASQTIPAGRVADLLVLMLTWPFDSTLGELAIAPWRTQARLNYGRG
ncbi:MAG: SDR family NAD(P)-dependent oxidoreductase [Desulfobaccales bacterium]